MERTRRRIAQVILLPLALIVLVAGAAAPVSAAPRPAPSLAGVMERPTSLNW
jgi:hypothetical protein